MIVMDTLPSLRVVKTTDLILHEAVDPQRVAKLKKIIARATVLTNPPVVAHLPGSRKYAVLDGANRTTVFRDLGYSHVVVQLVPYREPYVKLLTWNHVLDGVRLETIINQLAALPGISVTTYQSQVTSVLMRGCGLACLVSGTKVWVIRASSGFPGQLRILNDIVHLYKGIHKFHRVLATDFHALQQEYPHATVLFVFRKFTPRDVVRAVTHNLFLPSGITRHIVLGRVLRLDIPLVWLHASTSLAYKNTQLRKLIAERFERNKIRYYTEPVFIYND